jgi:hypothetical protein
LGLEEPRVIAEIPKTYIPDTPPGTIYNGKAVSASEKLKS